MFQTMSLLKELEFESADTDLTNVRIKSEYDRLSENYNTGLSTVSRVVPTINKWTYRGNAALPGVDVRNNEYRLNFNDAFGTYSFASSVPPSIPV